MGEAKNPFGVRNGIIVAISDLSENERGYNCNCLCPDCKAHFIARLGNVRTHHFAHDGTPCDPVKAIMTSLYMLLQEAIAENHRFTFPDCYVSYTPFPNSRYATIGDIRSRMYLDSNKNNGRRIIEGKGFNVDSFELIRNSSGEPQALILTKGKAEHQLAVVLRPPESVCKSPPKKQFRDLATVCISITEDLYQITSSSLKSLLRDGRKGKEWVSSPSIDKWIRGQVEAQHQRYAAYREQQEKNRAIMLEQQRIQREAEQARQKKLAQQRKADELKRRQEAELRKQAEQEEEILRYQAHLTVTYPTPPEDKKIMDMFNRRWVFCDTCCHWKLETEMTSYGGNGRNKNRGTCRACIRKNTST